jgi:hypothetical protein
MLETENPPGIVPSAAALRAPPGNRTEAPVHLALLRPPGLRPGGWTVRESGSVSAYLRYIK